MHILFLLLALVTLVAARPQWTTDVDYDYNMMNDAAGVVIDYANPVKKTTRSIHSATEPSTEHHRNKHHHHHANHIHKKHYYKIDHVRSFFDSFRI